MQNKAPIRSQTLGPATLGERRTRPTGQFQGSSANPSTGQIGPTFRSDLRLSVLLSTCPRKLDHYTSRKLN